MKKKIKDISGIIRLLYGSKSNTFFDNFDSKIINTPDKSGRTLIFHALLQGDEEIVKKLYSLGAKINIQDNLGWTPLHYAAQNYLPSIAKFLIENGAEIDKTDSNGNSVLWRAVFASQGRGEIIDLLLSAGANPNLENNHNISPIKLARAIANYDIKKL